MTSSTAPTVLVVGSTGSIGRLTVAAALAHGYRVRALVRDAERASHIVPVGAELVTGDVTRPESLRAAVDGADAVIFTHGVETTEQAIEQVSYAGVRDLLWLLAGRDVRIVLMSAVGVTARSGLYNTLQLAEWKRRAERLVRFSGQPYTIVRPGWFDENGPDEHRLVLRQGDRHHAGDPGDGAVSREQIAQVLVAALSSPGPPAGRSSSSPNRALRRRIWSRCWQRCLPTRPTASTPPGTCETCRWMRSRSACATICASSAPGRDHRLREPSSPRST
ncbi:SDR family oxidoreductase [Brachybacterium sp. Z12]|uniref:SDR family oxidoreductase n=1 Tax=Brachybacterium sp. Z12 TaxID=2759167 RepID=UPI00223ADD5D|nr:SDR family oxidoreductase [Brachybacterium sp. Z12]